MTINELLNLDISKLTKPELEKVAGFAQSVANRRLTTWEKYDSDNVIPSAVRKTRNYLYSQNAERFDIKGKSTFNQQRKELARVIRFIEDETSTVSGWRKVKSDVRTKIQEKTGVKISQKNFDDLFKTYEKMKEIDKNVASKELKYRVWNLISAELEDTMEEPDELAIRLADQLETLISEREEAVRDAEENISDLLEFDEDL